MDEIRNHPDDQANATTQLAAPAVRLFAIMEAMSRGLCYFTLQEMVQETGIPKPTVYRILQQLESAGLLQRDGDERHYGLGARLRQIAHGLLLNDSLHSGRHLILQQLREAIGESCNLTALSNGEVVYLDRVETAAPLRFYLHPGSRVPVHCSATGKLFLGQLSVRQRQQLLGSGPLEKHTANTLTDLSALENEIERCRHDGYAIDNEEFLPGLICLAVLVPSQHGKSNLGLAMQGPTMRLSVSRVKDYLPHLRQAAQAMAALEDTAAP
ncbi:MAG: IclR family transcriptional regulator [Lautropia sp.]|nr:IclR family transcriptional regulator [Lautropia sp.]